MTPYRVTLVYDDFPALPEGELDRLVAALAADPPAGFSCKQRYGAPVLTGLREAESQFAAIAEVAAEVKERHGLAFNSAGVEKPDEWLSDEYDQETAAHLVLAAVHRAKHCGVDPADLTRLIAALRD
ncbi:hypothetical protein [Streptomyces apocyni]|uniref:hypothetical protein n=1 Tax=Streptomyces apocyni TaxID=2654677 RepID=UPI0012EA0DFC|nr:hypothetical protein [Streptomyces apocyni]